jgi:RNA polymerase sigma-70 factor, ECF subfamily
MTASRSARPASTSSSEWKRIVRVSLPSPSRRGWSPGISAPRWNRRLTNFLEGVKLVMFPLNEKVGVCHLTDSVTRLSAPRITSRTRRIMASNGCAFSSNHRSTSLVRFTAPACAGLAPRARGRFLRVLPADDVLVTGLRSGDEATFASLLDTWSASMIRLARGFVSTDASAEDVVQDTWLAVIRGIHGFHGTSSLRTWVYRILVNTAKKRGVKEKRTVPWTSVEPDAGPTVDPSRFRGAGEEFPGHWREFPEPWVLDGEFRQIVQRALDDLPERQRTVVALRDVEGHTSEEVCAMLEISAANQRVLLHRGRASVRTRLEAYFATAGGAA